MMVMSPPAAGEQGEARGENDQVALFQIAGDLDVESAPAQGGHAEHYRLAVSGERAPICAPVSGDCPVDGELGPGYERCFWLEVHEWPVAVTGGDPPPSVAADRPDAALGVDLSFSDRPPDTQGRA